MGGEWSTRGRADPPGAGTLWVLSFVSRWVWDVPGRKLPEGRVLVRTSADAVTLVSGHSGRGRGFHRCQATRGRSLTQLGARVSEQFLLHAGWRVSGSQTPCEGPLFRSSCIKGSSPNLFPNVFLTFAVTSGQLCVFGVVWVGAALTLGQPTGCRGMGGAAETSSSRWRPSRVGP